MKRVAVRLSVVALIILLALSLGAQEQPGPLIRDVKIVGPLKVGHLVESSLKVGSAVSKFRGGFSPPSRWQGGRFRGGNTPLVQIQTQEQV